MPAWTSHWLRDVRLLLASQLLVVVTTTALAILLARSLGPSDWGLFSALLGLSQALSTFVNLGMGTWLLRELARLQDEGATPERRYSESSRRIIGGVIASATFGIVLLSGAIVVLALIRTEIETAIALVGLIVYTVFVVVANCMEALLRAERRLKTVVAATLLERFLVLALAGTAVQLDSGIWALGLAHTFAGFARLSFVGYTIFVKRRFPIVVPAFQHIRRFVLNGVPFAFNTVALQVIPRLDTLVVLSMSATAAGFFALGDRILGPALIVPWVASAALYPFLAREAPRSKAALRISVGMFGLGLTLAIAGALIAPYIVPTVFGGSYGDAVIVVQVMLLATPFVYASNPLIAHLYTSGKERSVFAITILASVLGTAFVVGGQVSFGVTGAGVGYVLRQLLFTLALAGIALVQQSRAAEDALQDTSVVPLLGTPDDATSSTSPSAFRAPGSSH